MFYGDVDYFSFEVSIFVEVALQCGKYDDISNRLTFSTTGSIRLSILEYLAYVKHSFL